MKIKLILFVFLLSLFIFLQKNVYACIAPTDDLYINNDTILCSGTYYINDASNDGVIIINSSNIVLDGNGSVIIGNGNGYGIFMNGKNNNMIKDINISGYNFGIYIYSSSNNNHLINNTANNNNYGIALYSSSNNTVSNNNINSLTQQAILVDSFSNYNKIKNNYITSSGTQTTLIEGYGNILQNNTIINTKNLGTAVYVVGNNTLINNTIETTAYQKSGFSTYGSIVVSGGYSKIYNNTILGHVYAIYVMGSAQNTTIENNIIKNFDNGIADSKGYIYIDEPLTTAYNERNLNINNNLFFNNSGTNMIRTPQTISSSLKRFYNINITNNKFIDLQGDFSNGAIWLDITTVTVTEAIFKNIIIKNNYFDNVSFGPWLEGNMENILIENNTITNTHNSGTGIVCFTNRACKNVTFRENTIINDTSDYGAINLWAFAENVTITKNKIYDSKYGIYLYKYLNYPASFSNINITENLLSSIEETSISMFNATNVLVENNQISGTSIGTGILLNFSNNDALINNTIYKKLYGIYLDSSSNNTLLNNIINNNTRNGIYFYNTSNNILKNNTALYNSHDLYFNIIENITSINNTFGENLYFGNTGAFRNVSFYNLTILDYVNGKIIYTFLNITQDANTTNNLNISYNNITINSSALPDFNISATLYFYNIVGISNPTAYRNGQPCPSSICINFRTIGTNSYVFDVNQFTSYSVGEAPTCVTPTDDLYINNDTILCPGAYYINDAGANGVIIINASNITLEGNSTVIIGNGSGYGITTLSSLTNITIKDITISNFSRNLQLDNLDKAYIYNITSSDANDIGILVYNARNVIINKSLFNNSYKYNVRFGLGQANLANDSMIINSIIKNSQTDSSLIVTDGKNITIRNNTLENNYLGMAFCEFSDGLIENNNIDGILWGTINNTYIKNNTLTSAGLFPFCILQIDSSCGYAPVPESVGIITNNTLVNCTYGIMIFGNVQKKDFFGNMIFNDVQYGLAVMPVGGATSVSNKTIKNMDLTQAEKSLYILNASLINFTNLTINEGIISSNSNISFANLTIKNQYGKIFYPFLNITQDANTTNNLNINYNNITLNSLLLPDFNISATLYFYNIVGISNPTAYRNGQPCPSTICSNFQNLGNNNYAFDVTGFTSYSIGEGEAKTQPRGRGRKKAILNHHPKIVNASPSKLEIYLTNKTSLNFYAKARDIDNDNITLRFYLDGLDGIVEKEYKGKEEVEGNYEITLDKNHTIIAYVIDGKGGYDQIVWHIYMINLTNKTCIDYWQCSEWSNCSEDGYKQRECWKINPECENNANKPETLMFDPKCVKFEKPKSNYFWIIIFFLIILIAIIFIIYLIYRKLKRK